MYQSFIIEIDISKLNALTSQCIVTQCRFPATPDAYDNLRLRTAQIYSVFLFTLTEMQSLFKREFLCLVGQYRFKYPFIHNSRFINHKDNKQFRQNALFYIKSHFRMHYFT